MKPTKDNFYRKDMVRIAKVGPRYGYTLRPDENQRGPMPVALLVELGFVAAARELVYEKGYPGGGMPRPPRQRWQAPTEDGERGYTNGRAH